MKNYRLSYLPLFDEDLAEAWSYIANKLHNPEAADKLVADVEAAILKRLDTPESFEPYRSVKERKYLYYRIYVKNFAVFAGAPCYISAFLGAALDIGVKCNKILQ